MYFWQGRILIPVTGRQTAPLLKWAFCQKKKQKKKHLCGLLCIETFVIFNPAPLNRRTQRLDVLLHWQRLFSTPVTPGCLSPLRTLGCLRRRGGRHPGTWRKQFFCVFCQDDMKWWDSFWPATTSHFQSQVVVGVEIHLYKTGVSKNTISLSPQPAMAFTNHTLKYATSVSSSKWKEGQFGSCDICLELTRHMQKWLIDVLFKVAYLIKMTIIHKKGDAAVRHDNHRFTNSC